jgi:hypothetical protein
LAIWGVMVGERGQEGILGVWGAGGREEDLRQLRKLKLLPQGQTAGEAEEGFELWSDCDTLWWVAGGVGLSRPPWSRPWSSLCLVCWSLMLWSPVSSLGEVRPPLASRLLHGLSTGEMAAEPFSQAQSLPRGDSASLWARQVGVGPG